MSDAPPGADAVTISHLAGPAASIDVDDETSRLRQRCVWCGALLIDTDVRNDDTDDDEDLGYEPGGMVRHDLGSGVWFAIPWDDEADIPGDSCMLLPIELTGSAGRPPETR